MPRERFIAVMVVHMRVSTLLAAARLPYDNVFILGRSVAAISAAVVQACGLPNQFPGDGVLAIFGLQCDARIACRQAVMAVGLTARNLRSSTSRWCTNCPRPLSCGTRNISRPRLIPCAPGGVVAPDDQARRRP